MDILSDIIGLLRTKGDVYGQVEFTEPFGYNFPLTLGHFIFITNGMCYLKIEGRDAIPLIKNEFVFMPKNTEYCLLSDSNIQTTRELSIEERRQFLENNSLAIDETSGEKTSMITGCFRFTSPESHLLLEHLPTILHMKDQDRLNNAWPCPLLQIISNEITLNQVGSAVIIDRLIETLFIYSLRYYFLSDNNVNLPSWLSALNDKNIGKSLQLMHANLAHNWSLQSLADKVGMSRSSFSQKFKQRVGRTPVEHLTQWRMVHAGALIRQEKNMKLISIAQAVGYESESSFRKTFTKIMGQTPKRYKLRH